MHALTPEYASPEQIRGQAGIDRQRRLFPRCRPLPVADRTNSVRRIHQERARSRPGHLRGGARAPEYGREQAGPERWQRAGLIWANRGSLSSEIAAPPARRSGQHRPQGDAQGTGAPLRVRRTVRRRHTPTSARAAGQCPARFMVLPHRQIYPPAHRHRGGHLDCDPDSGRRHGSHAARKAHRRAPFQRCPQAGQLTHLRNRQLDRRYPRLHRRSQTARWPRARVPRQSEQGSERRQVAADRTGHGVRKSRRCSGLSLRAQPGGQRGRARQLPESASHSRVVGRFFSQRYNPATSTRRK